jgi:hypothetical protein
MKQAQFTRFVLFATALWGNWWFLLLLQSTAGRRGPTPLCLISTQQPEATDYSKVWNTVADM